MLSTQLTGQRMMQDVPDVLADLLGDSPEIKAVRERIERLLHRQQDGRRLPPILIQGETGTGKGLLARMIHKAGPRPAGPFVDVNCAAIPEALLESEMFGFERGAFTDARRAKAGLFQTAHRGTIFLDEVGLLPEALQAKLLKVLEERTVRRLGSTRDEPVDVWILAATNEDLRTAIRERRFREDLYHRLAVLTVAMPPLRERGADIVRLAEHFLARTCVEYGVPPKTLAADARAALTAYAWPGNVRELINMMERAGVLSDAPELTAPMLGLGAPAAPAGPAAGEGASLDDAVREHVLAVLRQTGWNISRSAQALGITRNTLRARIEKYDLAPERGAPAPRRGAPRRLAPTVEAPRPPTALPALRWERRRVTLLRATLAPRADAETPLDTNRPLEAILDKVRTFGGTIDGMSPTGVLAAFGLDAVEDAPGRAVLAAMAMQKAVARLVEGVPAPPALRVGIHVGQFLVGHGADDAQLDEDAKQAALTTLERMLANVEPGAVVVGEGAMPFVGRRFELLELPARPAGGSRVWMLGARERAETAAGRRTLFVGRRRELELLWSRLDTATRGQGQIVGIAGDAGIGKSRLIAELRQSLVGRGVGYLEGRCQTYGAAIPYLPVLALVRAELGVTEIDSADAVGAKIRAGLVPLGHEAAEATPLVLHLLGAADGNADLDPIEPPITKAHLTAALRALVLRRSRREPLVILIEDLHWIDTASDELLSSLAELVTGARILLACTYRPGYRPAWIDRSYATQVALSPLAPDESLSVVRAVLGGTSLDESLVELILSKGEGNPLFLEELAHTLREAGGGQAPAVPDTVEEVLLARIDRLADADKRLLQTAAVIGKDVPTALLRAVAAQGDDALRATLARLRGAEFLYEVVPGPEGEHTFKHALTQEVAYASLLPAERVALHARSVDALERLGAAARADDPERLAHHAFHGQIWERAVVHCREAGARATARSANREAVARLSQALEALARLPDSRENLEDAIDVRLALRTALLPLGEFARILDHLRQAETVATGLGDQRRLGQICAYLTNHFFVTGSHDRALENGQRADAIATALGDFALRLETDLRLGQVYHALGQYRRAAAVLERTVASLEGEQLYERFGLPLVFSVGCLSWLIRSLTELGAYADGARHGESAVRIAETARHPFTLTVAYWSLGHLYLRQGDLPPAIAMLDKGLGLSRTWTIAVWVPRLSSALGSALALSGRLGEALPLLEEAVDRSNALRTGDHAVSLMALGEGYLLAGRHADAARAAAEALATARARGERGYEAWAQRLLGEIATHGAAADPRGAETGFRDGLALAEELGMRPLAAHCRLGIARAARALGRKEDADAQLTAAATIYRELDMPLWRSRAAAERSASV